MFVRIDLKNRIKRISAAGAMAYNAMAFNHAVVSKNKILCISITKNGSKSKTWGRVKIFCTLDVLPDMLLLRLSRAEAAAGFLAQQKHFTNYMRRLLV